MERLSYNSPGMKEDPREYLKASVRSIADYPKPGIVFRDLTTVFQDGKAYSIALDLMADCLIEEQDEVMAFDKFAGIEARGFILAGALAAKLGKGVVLLRKPDKLPYKKRRIEYTLEYGKDALEIHDDAIVPGERIILIDDLLATGGTAAAGCKLIEASGGTISKVLFLVELPELGGRGKLKGYETDTIITFEGH